MGSGIAQIAASAGFETVVREVSDELIQRGFTGIEKSLAKFAEERSDHAEQQKAIRDRFPGTTSFDDLADCDIIIEAIIENIEEKRSTYAELDQHLQTGNDVRFQHFINFDHGNDDGDFAGAAATVYRPALFQSRSDDEAGGSGQNDSDRRGDLRTGV